MIEAEFRSVLQERIEARYLSDGGHLVHELAIPQHRARVDIAVVGNNLVGFEIKTANDTLSRLARQQDAYNKVFDRMYLAVEHRHLARALLQAPAWWGVLELAESAGGLRWVQHRSSRLNPAVDLHALAQLLWRQEVLDELDELGLAKGVRSASKQVLWRALADAAPRVVSRRDLHARLRRRLIARGEWRAAR